MNTALQQRLIGAIVLVAVAVIFLPMLLDGSGARERFDVAMDIPDQPQAPQSRIEDTPEPAADGERPGATEPALDAGRRGDDEEDTEVTRAGDAAEAGTREIPAPADGDTTDAAATDAAGDGDTASPDDDETQGGAGAWVVQVGSFARETNALVLRDQLREDGYEAFVEKGEGDEQTWWRVRVGPVSEREQAEELGAALERERDGASVLVMSHP